ncbi:hypothetical protein BCR43DRAFT_90206 [Syncephalastrum racemosum]|uniref:Uncharacterized protein n=1 Tax=Syncephalastrum racemosum TaxID=13706 RepID=A0A1X2H3J8_SYNRA|nr:hypothetical protein BCR43DRAFT_90206 [Syncephalastrum racemosum]
MSQYQRYLWSRFLRTRVGRDLPRLRRKQWSSARLAAAAKIRAIYRSVNCGGFCRISFSKIDCQGQEGYQAQQVSAPNHDTPLRGPQEVCCQKCCQRLQLPIGTDDCLRLSERFGLSVRSKCQFTGRQNLTVENYAFVLGSANNFRVKPHILLFLVENFHL